MLSSAPDGDLECLSEAPADVRVFRLLSGDPVRDLSGLRHLPDTLEELSLSTRWSRRPSLAPLARFRALRNLSLTATSAGFRDVDVLGELHALRHLYLRSFKALDLSPLLRLPALQTLELSFGSRAGGLSVLAGVPTLRWLKVECCREPDALAGLGDVRSVEFLDVDECPQVVAFPDLSRLDALRYAHVGTMKRLADVSGLASAPNLAQVLLTAMPQATPEWLAPLTGHRGIRRMSVGTGTDLGNGLAKEAHGLPDVRNELLGARPFDHLPRPDDTIRW